MVPSGTDRLLLNMKNKENILVPKDKEIFLFLRSPKLVEMHTLHLLESLMAAANATHFFLGEVWDLPERGGWNMIAAALRVSSHERNTLFWASSFLMKPSLGRTLS